MFKLNVQGLHWLQWTFLFLKFLSKEEKEVSPWLQYFQRLIQLHCAENWKKRGSACMLLSSHDLCHSPLNCQNFDDKWKLNPIILIQLPWMSCPPLWAVWKQFDTSLFTIMKDSYLFVLGCNFHWEICHKDCFPPFGSTPNQRHELSLNFTKLEPQASIFTPEWGNCSGFHGQFCSGVVIKQSGTYMNGQLLAAHASCDLSRACSRIRREVIFIVCGMCLLSIQFPIHIYETVSIVSLRNWFCRLCDFYWRRYHNWRHRGFCQWCRYQKFALVFTQKHATQWTHMSWRIQAMSLLTRGCL